MPVRRLDDPSDTLACLQWLHYRGSGDPVLLQCDALSSVGLVRKARARGAIRPLAVRAFLEMAASEPRVIQVHVAAALTGIIPRSISSPHKGGAGPQERRNNAALVDGKGGPGRFAAPEQRTPYLEAYISALLELEAAAEVDPELVARYQRLCGVLGEVAAPDASKHPSSTPGIDPRSLPFSFALERQLQSVFEFRAGRGEDIYTTDILEAVVSPPSDRVLRSFDEVEIGFGERFRRWVSRRAVALDRPRSSSPRHWSEVSAIQLARRLAAEDGSPSVTELHVLLGCLEASSGTRDAMSDALGADLERFRLGVQAILADSQSTVRTPDVRENKL